MYRTRACSSLLASGEPKGNADYRCVGSRRRVTAASARSPIPRRTSEPGSDWLPGNDVGDAAVIVNPMLAADRKNKFIMVFIFGGYGVHLSNKSAATSERRFAPDMWQIPPNSGVQRNAGF